MSRIEGVFDQEEPEKKKNTYTIIHKAVFQDIVGDPKAFKCFIPGASAAVLVSLLLKG